MEGKWLPKYAVQLIKLHRMIMAGRQIRVGTSRWNMTDTVRLVAELRRKERMS